MDYVVIKCLSVMGFQKAATSYCSSIDTKSPPYKAGLWTRSSTCVCIHPLIQDDCQCLQPVPNHQPRLSSFLAQDGLNYSHPKAGPDPETTLCHSSAGSAGLCLPPSSAQPPVERWSALSSGTAHKEAAQTAVLNESFCLAPERASKYIWLLLLLLPISASGPFCFAHADSKQRIQLVFPFSFPLSNRAQGKK